MVVIAPCRRTARQHQLETKSLNHCIVDQAWRGAVKFICCILVQCILARCIYPASPGKEAGQSIQHLWPCFAQNIHGRASAGATNSAGTERIWNDMHLQPGQPHINNHAKSRDTLMSMLTGSRLPDVHGRGGGYGGVRRGPGYLEYVGGRRWGAGGGGATVANLQQGKHILVLAQVCWRGIPYASVSIAGRGGLFSAANNTPWCWRSPGCPGWACRPGWIRC